MKRAALLCILLILCLFTAAVYADEWICSVCGATNSKNFCTSCGAKRTGWICPNCGEENYDAYCGNCGTAQPSTDNTAEEFIYEGVHYKALEDGTLCVIQGDPDIEEVIIPATINGIQVTKIASAAFRGNKKLKSVFLPDGIVEICYYAFMDCTSLKTVNIPSTIETIGACAFTRSAINHLYIPSNTHSISEMAFSQCPNLRTVYFEDGIEEMSNNIFEGCQSIISVRLPGTLKVIPEETFMMCINLSEVIIPYGIEKIGKGAFINCFALDKLFIPDSVTTIEDAAFRLCKNLSSIYIPDSVEDLSYNAFADCDTLREITLVKGSEAYKQLYTRQFTLGIDYHILETSELWNTTHHDIVTGNFHFDNTFTIADITFYLPHSYRIYKDITELSSIQEAEAEALTAYIENNNIALLAYDGYNCDFARIIVNQYDDPAPADYNNPLSLLAELRLASEQANNYPALSLRRASLFTSTEYSNLQETNDIVWVKALGYHKLNNVQQIVYTTILENKYISIAFQKKNIYPEDENRYDDIVRLCTSGTVLTNRTVSGTTDFSTALPMVDPSNGKIIEYYELYYTTTYDNNLRKTETEHKRPVYRQGPQKQDPNKEFKQAYMILFLSYQKEKSQYQKMINKAMLIYRVISSFLPSGFMRLHLKTIQQLSKRENTNTPLLTKTVMNSIVLNAEAFHEQAIIMYTQRPTLTDN